MSTERRVDPKQYLNVTADFVKAAGTMTLERKLDELKSLTGPRLGKDFLAKRAVRAAIDLVYRELDSRRVAPPPLVLVEPPGAPIELMPPPPPIDVHVAEAVAAEPLEGVAVEVATPFGRCCKHHDRVAVGMTDRCEPCWELGE